MKKSKTILVLIIALCATCAHRTAFGLDGVFYFMKKIQLTNGMTTQVDDHWYDYLNQFKWHAMRSKNVYYAGRWVRKDKKQKSVLMHREILGLTDPRVFGEHRDGNGLNNLEGNLRTATQQQNNMNKAQKTNSKTEYMGVSAVCSKSQTWSAYITASGKRYYLGKFDDKEIAAFYRDRAAIKLHGEFARLNFPELA